MKAVLSRKMEIFSNHSKGNDHGIFTFSKSTLTRIWQKLAHVLNLGIALMILGCFAIAASAFTTLVSVVLLGFVIFFSGVIMALDTFTFWMSKWSGFFIHATLAILYIAVGLMLINNPVEGSISLTLLLGIFYTIAGIFRIGFATSLQTPKWKWSLFNGIITLILGILILNSWPASSLFIIGLFVGIDLFFVGWAYVMGALAAHSLMTR